MNQIQTLRAVSEPQNSTVKKSLIRVIIFLTSTKFNTFVSVIAFLICFWGNLIDNPRTVGWGGLVFLIGFAPWAWRETLRSMRHPDRI